jgi:hypothetical protein
MVYNIVFLPQSCPHTHCRPLPQINFDRCLKGNMGNNCLITVDGTNFQISQKGLPKKENPFVSHKFAGKSVLRYKLGVSIFGGDLVWIQGPYPTGKYTDIKIFNNVLRHFLEPGEQVEADDGYRGHADKKNAQRMTQTRWQISGCRAG